MLGLLILLAPIVEAKLTIVMKGNWLTQCSGVIVSTHNRYDKALESAINQNKHCNVIPPSRFEVSVDTQPRSIELTWDLPELREDGSKIEKIDRFNIYIYFNDVLQNTIEVAGDVISYQLSEVETGNYSFQISTVEDGQEGKLSPKIYQDV